jgi:hypothetical protein
VPTIDASCSVSFDVVSGGDTIVVVRVECSRKRAKIHDTINGGRNAAERYNGSKLNYSDHDVNNGGSRGALSSFIIHHSSFTLLLSR